MASGKLKKLAELEGFEDPFNLLSCNQIDSVVPGICMNEGCDYTTQVEPDSREGWCEACETNTVRSCLVLGGVL